MRISSWTLFLSLLVVPLFTGCQTTDRPVSEVKDDEERVSNIYFDSYFNMQEFKGMSYLNFMKRHIKPAMDTLATDGYRMRDGRAVTVAYNNADRKIQNRVDRSWGGMRNVQSIADRLEGQTVTLHDLPGKIRRINSRVDSYGLATFLGLASGGGVKIKYYDKNYSLNVHYDRFEERSGRSFGVGPTRRANDASDKQYLDDLEDYVKRSPRNIDRFYGSMFEALLNSDGAGFANVTDEGQTILSDFLSVFTAEQARNLMDGRVSPHWDAALMEVTLLAAFHSGQDRIKMFYYNPGTGRRSFTSETLKQTPCRTPSRSQRAKLRDYWQFSRNINSERNCGRSGINITRDEFRKLGQMITGWMYSNERELFDMVKASMDINGAEYNLYSALSDYLISSDSPSSFSEQKISQVRDSWVKFLLKTQERADEITRYIDSQE